MRSVRIIIYETSDQHLMIIRLLQSELCIKHYNYNSNQITDDVVGKIQGNFATLS